VLFKEFFERGIGGVVLEELGFDGSEACETEVGRGHALDQNLFDRALRLELGAEAVVDLGEPAGVFAGEEALGSESMEEVVAAGASLTFGGTRTRGFLSIAPVGRDLAFSSHVLFRFQGSAGRAGISDSGG
jgi:hypothetical protein